MKIGVTGATGQLGRIVVAQLKESTSSNSIVAIVRSTQKAADLRVETREADYGSPDTLAIALEGIHTLVLISGSEIGNREAQHKNVIDAARKAGISRIIYTSLLHADTSSLVIADEHIATERMLKEAGISFTILRNGWYTENYRGSVASGVESGTFIGSAGDGKISSASRKDYAEAIVVVAISEGHEGIVYELAGDESFTLSDLAAEVSAQTGKEVTYTNLPAEEYAAALSGGGLPDSLAQMLTGIDVSTAQDDLYDASHQLSKLIGRPTTPLKAAVAEMLTSTQK